MIMLISKIADINKDAIFRGKLLEHTTVGIELGKNSSKRQETTRINAWSLNKNSKYS